MHWVDSDAIRTWLQDASGPALRGGLGREPSGWSGALPIHLEFALRASKARSVAEFASIPFRSLCHGVLLPLSRMHSSKTSRLFGFGVPPTPDVGAREALLSRFLRGEFGIGLLQKLGCLLGNPFLGRTSGFKRDSLLRLLTSLALTSRRDLLDRLSRVGDVGILFAEIHPPQAGGPPLSASEVLTSLQYLPDAPRSQKFEILRSLFSRCDKLEAYFLARLVLQKSDAGLEYESPALARSLAEYFGAEVDAVAHAISLSDTFHVVERLLEGGAESLHEIRLRPLVALRPALAGGHSDEVQHFPVWVERKYDGIRLILHKSTDSRGSILCAAHTRGQRDWLELVPGLDATIRLLPCRTGIVDGELHGTVIDRDGSRPGTVYEIYAALQGERQTRSVSLRFAAFDLLYIDGNDVTARPLSERRARLQALVAPITSFPLALPITLADGQVAGDSRDLARLYQHFRAQGHEGIVCKSLEGPYMLGRRDPEWRKRKPELTLDLVLLAGVFAVTEKATHGLFGSFVVGARNENGSFTDLGDVAGVAQHVDAEIQAEIMRSGLLTGQRVERSSASGVRAGVALRPAIVVTLRIDGVLKDDITGELRLRDPRLVLIRSDKHPGEADTLQTIERMWLKERMG